MTVEWNRGETRSNNRRGHDTSLGNRLSIRDAVDEAKVDKMKGESARF
jgi:hypothetical protein